MPRTDSANFVLKNKSLSKKPLYVIEIAFDAAFTDLHCFTSNKRAAVPSTATNIYHGYIVGISGTSQQLNPIRFQSTIGQISFELLDVSSTVTSLLNTKLVAGYGTRHKRVRVYVGYEGLVWDDYTLVQTQLIEGVDYFGGKYTFNCIDIQRQLKDDIFDLYETNLNASITFGDVLIPAPTAAAIANFDTLQHTSIYSDAPSATVGYIRIADEIIRWSSKSSANFVVDNESSTPSVSASPVGIASGATSIPLTDASAFPNGGNQAYGVIIEGATKSTIRWTGKTSNTLTGVTGVDNAFTTSATVYWAKGRGALNTVAVNHDVDPTADTDKRPRIDEYVYFEVPVVQAIYGLLTGTLHNSGSPQGIELPANWHLGISTSYVSLAYFTAMQYASIWNPADDTDQTNNVYCFFQGETKQDGKKFIETQLLPQIGAFMPVLNNGELGLQLMAGVLSRSPYVRRLTNADIVGLGTLKHDHADTHNVFYTPWNWSPIKKQFTRPEVLIDTDSVSVHGTTTPLSIPLRGINGSRHTREYLYSVLNFLRDRYAGPPERLELPVRPSHNDLNVGDPIRVETDLIRDYSDANLTLNRTFEILGQSVDWITGSVSLNLFGSTQKAQPLSEFTTSSAVMDSSFWSSAGTDLSTNPGGITTSVSGGVLHIDGNGTLSGNADVTNSAAIYYTTEDDLNLDFGITANLTNNVQIRCKGNINIDGIFDGKGGGLAGASSGDRNEGSQGQYGVTRATGGINITNAQSVNNPFGIDGVIFDSTYAFEKPAKTSHLTPASLNIKNNSTSIAGLIADLRGTSGGSGGSVTGQLSADGGAGGNGGAGLLLICESLSFGGSGKIDLSGNDGSAGSTVSMPIAVRATTLHAGAGAGGHPGALYVLLTSNVGFATDLDTKFIANLGDSPVRAQELPSNHISNRTLSGAYQSHYPGYVGEDLSDAGGGLNPMYRVQHVPDSETAAEDVADITSKPSAISVQAATNTKNTLNVVTLELSVTPPADGNYHSSEISIAVDGTDSWQLVGTPKSTNEVLFSVPADGTTYKVRAQPISTKGIKSDDYIEAKYTVTSALTVRNAASGKIVFGDDDPATNGGMIISDAGIEGYDSSANKTIDLKSSDGSATFGIVSAEKFVQFDGTDLKLGRDSKLLGADAYNNNSIYFSGAFSDYKTADFSSGGGSVTHASGYSSFRVTSSGNAGSNLNREYHFVTPTFAKNRRLKITASISSSTSVDAAIVTGQYSSGTKTDNHIGFVFTSGNIYASNANGTTQTSTSIVSSYSLTTTYTLEFRFLSGTSIKFYVNGSLSATHTTNLPSNTNFAILMLSPIIEYTSATSTLTIGPFRFDQDE